MRIDVLTLFPAMIDAMKCSIIGRAEETGALEISAHDIRAFSKDKHKRCDDYTFGGGGGMLMTPQPVFDAVRHVDPGRAARRIYMSARGKSLTDEKARRLSKLPHIVILCGHYEGVDQRVIDSEFDEEISIGDYVLTGGELPAMVLIDCVARYIPSVLGNSQSLELESFRNNLLEYPQYTRPAVWNGIAAPEILLSGHHENIDKWRKDERETATKNTRPDLMDKKPDGQSGG